MRVLQVFAEPLLYGGQESAIMNFYSAIDRERFQFDFFTPYEAGNNEMLKRIEEVGGRVFAQNKPFEDRRRKYYFISELTGFLSRHNYEIVHINSGSSFALAKGAQICRKAGVKKVIVHSHATGVDNLKHKVVRTLYDPYFIKYPDYCLGCSEDVIRYRYPKVVSEKCRVIYNGIDTDKFRFNKEVRLSKRKELGIEKEFVLGSVGRLSPEKNPLFVIEVFKEILHRDPSAKLLMIGSGSMKVDVERRIMDADIDDSVIMLENRSDISDLMCAMDAFVLPSIFEGFGMVAIEAQCSDLPCVCSLGIPERIKIASTFKRISLTEGAPKWCDLIMGSRQSIRKVENAIQGSAFDIQKCVHELELLYE